jgi:deoxyadenosine/deoxycytidine kinase
MVRFIILSIEGNIGGGKSTMLQSLKIKHPEYIYIDEPVDMWQSLKTDDNKSLLQLFYQDTTRWAYTLQNTAFITRVTNAKQAIDSLKDQPNDKVYVLITERCVLTDRYVFAQMLKDDHKLSDIEWNVYLFWYQLFCDMIPIKGLIYISTEYDVCVDRIKHRNREGEENIPVDYLRSLQDYHTKWIDNTELPVCCISSEESEMDKIVDFIEHLKLDSIV